MTYSVYSIYDKVSGEFGSPFLSLKNAQAVRQFQYMMSNSPMVAADCQLYCISEFDTETGRLVGTSAPEFICNYEVSLNE